MFPNVAIDPPRSQKWPRRFPDSLNMFVSLSLIRIEFLLGRGGFGILEALEA